MTDSQMLSPSHEGLLERLRSGGILRRLCATAEAHEVRLVVGSKVRPGALLEDGRPPAAAGFASPPAACATSSAAPPPPATGLRPAARRCRATASSARFEQRVVGVCCVLAFPAVPVAAVTGRGGDRACLDPRSALLTSPPPPPGAP